MALDPRTKVTFDAGGKTYTLQYTTNAFCELEDETGMKVLDIIANGEPSMKVIRAMVWAGLLEHHEGITIKQAGHVIDAAGGMEVVMDKVNAAVAAGTIDDDDAPEAGDDGAKKPKAA